MNSYVHIVTVIFHLAIFLEYKANFEDSVVPFTLPHSFVHRSFVLSGGDICIRLDRGQCDRLLEELCLLWW